MREVVLDTETTGLDPEAGHRIVEIACLELVQRVPTGKIFHSYVDPERDMPDEAFQVHGLSEEFLSTQPRFAEIAAEFLSFVEDADLVIHNADFDMKFLNAELARLNQGPLSDVRVRDTLEMARRRFPGVQVSLDALCRRFGIDNSGRVTHGARLDVELLTEVYLELTGGRQPGLGLAAGTAGAASSGAARCRARPARPHAPTQEESEAHGEFLKGLNKPLWMSGRE
ncbi:MAG: DNA polymerase III subunit epsilon [Alphaproteobacteria bacterium]